MKYILRADASREIGAGHVMRSSAIAEELISRGKDVVFVGQVSGLPWVMERLGSLGFLAIQSSPINLEIDSASDVLILDSYEVPVEDDFISPQKWHKIISIVDENTPSYFCDLRIHPGLDSDWVRKCKTPILAGPNYIPFRSQISKNTFIKNHDNKVLKIVVVAGGSDQYGLVNELAKILHSLPDRFKAYLFGKLPNEFDLDDRFQYVNLGLSLDEVSTDANLVFTSASTSSLEFIARGLCVATVCVVENQRQNYEALGQLGVAQPVGEHSQVKGWELDVQSIHKLIINPDFRNRITEKGLGLIDFLGASRIVDAIIKL